MGSWPKGMDNGETGLTLPPTLGNAGFVHLVLCCRGFVGKDLFKLQLNNWKKKEKGARVISSFFFYKNSQIEQLLGMVI